VGTRSQSVDSTGGPARDDRLFDPRRARPFDYDTGDAGFLHPGEAGGR
jgi:hypothetical protein